MSTPASPDALARRAAWERVTTVPLTALSIIFVIAYSWRVLAHEPTPRLDAAAKITDIAIWVLFAADYAVRCRLSESAWKFVRTRPIELLVVLLPAFRPARVATVLVGTVTRHATRTRFAVSVLLSSLLLIYLCSLAMYDAERGAEGGTVRNFGDALWWAAATVTTVGYGDQYPVTVRGRLVAVVLMTLGISLIGFITATTTSWFVDKLHTARGGAGTGRGDAHQSPDMASELRELRAEMRAMRTEIEHLGRSARTSPTGSVGDEFL